jgi:hypothetical protein
MGGDEVLGWDAWGTDGRLGHANVVVLRVTPEVAMDQLVARIREKYGAGVDLAAWTFRAEPVPSGAGDVVSFRYEGGAFVRIE